MIPGNDDAIRAIKLISSVMANAIQEGKQGQDAALPQPLDGLVEVAVGLGEGLLAVHHADAGHLTQLLYVCRSAP